MCRDYYTSIEDDIIPEREQPGSLRVFLRILYNSMDMSIMRNCDVK